MAEIAVNADVHKGITALKFGKNVREEVEAGSFIGAEDDRSLNDVAPVGDDLNGFVAKAE